MTLRAARRMKGVERTLIRQFFDAAPRDAINLGLGQPDLPTPTRIALAGIRGIADGHTGYTHTAGVEALREAVAGEYPRFAEGAQSVVITVGSQEANFATLMTLVDAGEEVLVPDPGYPAYPMMVRLLGGRPVPYPLHAERGFRIDPEDVRSRLTRRTKALIVCSPSNPTGAVERAEDLAQLGGLLADRGVAWISDEIYAGFAYDGPLPSLSAFFPDGGVVISGLSKVLSMTGWRIGWVVGPATFMKRILAAHHYLVTCPPSISQSAAAAAFGPAARGDRDRYLEIFRQRRSLMAEELSRIPGVRFSLPGGAFYFFVDVRRFGESLPLSRRILDRRGVITIPGVAFGDRGEGFIRLSFAAKEDDIIRGVRAIGDELRGS